MDGGDDSGDELNGNDSLFVRLRKFSVGGDDRGDVDGPEATESPISIDRGVLKDVSTASPLFAVLASGECAAAAGEPNTDEGISLTSVGPSPLL